MFILPSEQLSSSVKYTVLSYDCKVLMRFQTCIMSTLQGIPQA